MDKRGRKERYRRISERQCNSFLSIVWFKDWRQCAWPYVQDHTLAHYERVLSQFTDSHSQTRMLEHTHTHTHTHIGKHACTHTNTHHHAYTTNMLVKLLHINRHTRMQACLIKQLHPHKHANNPYTYYKPRHKLTDANTNTHTHICKHAC